jgi:uncharacterized protein
MDGEEVQLKRDALAHLADALMEDIAATPPHQLAIEEIVDAGRSRELVFRFDDILAEAISSSSDRPAPLGSRAIWNLTDALCEEIAAHPDETVLTGVSEDRADDRSLAGKFDEILRRDRHLAMAGLKLPRQSGLSHAALRLKAALAQLPTRLIAPLQSRAAASAFATAVTVAIMTAVVYQPSRQTEEPNRFAAASRGAPKSPAVAQSAPLPAPGLAPSPVLADARNTRSAARSEASPPPQAVAADEEQKRFAAASPESPKPSAVSRAARPRAADLAPPPVPAEGRNAGSAAKPEASPMPSATAPDEGEKQIAAASMMPPTAYVESHLASPEGKDAGSAAKFEASPPPAVVADGGERRVAAARQTHTALALSPPAAAPQPSRKQRTAERSPIVGGYPDKASPVAPGIDRPLTSSDLPAAPMGQPNRLSARSGHLADIESGLKALEESARNGDVSALWKLGRIYSDGDGVPQNHLRAFEYFRRVAAFSDVQDLQNANARFVANAFVEVGRYYLTGVANSDLKPDPVRAHQMFTYAAVYFADPDAQYELARTFLDGVGVARDQIQGVRWLYEAAMKGQYDAQAKFGSLLFAGMGQVITRDAAKGLMWLKIAMDTAPRAAAGSIAEMYEAASKQATDEERTAASAYYEQWRRSRKLLSESDKPAGNTPAAGAGSPATHLQGPIGDRF